MFEIDIEKDFSAAHMLKGYQGDCSKLHGHNWKVQVVVKTEEIDEIGIAIDFRKLKTELDSILTELDHSNLNDIGYFTDVNPTSEILAKYFFDKLSEKINTGTISVSKVRVCESPGSGATYYNELN